MKLIKLLQNAIIIMFVILFSLFFIYIYNNIKIEHKNVFVEVIADEGVIEPIVASKENITLTVKPADESTVSNNGAVISNNTIKFYYENLDNYSKLIYTALENQKNDLKTGNSIINLPNELANALENGKNMEEIFSAAVNAFEFDNPDIFYLDASKLVLYYEKSTFGNYKIYLKHNDEYSNYLIPSFNNENDINMAQNKINLVVKDIIDEIKNIEDDYNKILYVHDWLASNIKYDESLNRTHKDSIYGALVEGESVCTGYAKSFKYILDKLNINTIIIQGIGINEQGQENHAWNYVELNRKWYGVDCTWDDPVILGDLTYYTEKKYYTYFLKGKNIFNRDHIPFEMFYETNFKINYPELSVEDYK